MAQPTNAFDSYDAVGNREDLSDIIYNISPTDTPFMTLAKRGKAQAVLHEWQTDALDAAAANAQIEGTDYDANAATATTRVVNRCQISAKTVLITGTQETVDKAGRKSELAYQLAKRGKELKRDMELVLTNNQTPVTGDSSTARALRPLEGWYATNDSRTGTQGNTTTAAVDGSQRAFTEDLLKDVIQLTWASGGDPDTLMVGPVNKQKVSGFAGNATRFDKSEDKRLVASIDVYESDFGAIKIVPNRFSRERTAHLLTSDMVAVDYLRPFMQEELAKTGDSEKRLLLAEYTLRVNNEAAHGVIADLTTT